MKKLSRIHYLKHYLGGKVLVMDPTHFGNGMIENIDLEDNSVLIKQGEKSHWISPDQVTLPLKRFGDIDQDTIDTLLSNVLFQNHKIDIGGMKMMKRDISFIEFSNGKFRMVLTDQWIIRFYIPHLSDEIPFYPTNMPAIIFLLCELGFDVCGIFHE